MKITLRHHEWSAGVLVMKELLLLVRWVGNQPTSRFFHKAIKLGNGNTITPRLCVSINATVPFKPVIVDCIAYT